MAKTLGQIRKENQYRTTSLKDKRQYKYRKKREKRNEFYHTPTWRRIREKYRKKKRSEHEKIVLDVYLENLEKNDPEQLFEFMFDDKKYPLSEKSLEEGKIRVANTCDHSTPIAEGGSKTSFKNLKWLTASQHSRKTFRENNINTKNFD